MILQLPKIWKGQPVTIVGGGPSLRGFDFGRLHGAVVGVNHSPKFHRADMLVAIDKEFHKREGAWLDSLDCMKVTYVDTPRTDFTVATLKPDHENYSMDLDWHILKANLSGYFALAVALHMGASKVYLLGYDGGYSPGKNPNFHPYFYEGPGMNYYTPMNQYYDFFSEEDIVNFGMDSSIEAFTKLPLDEY